MTLTVKGHPMPTNATAMDLLKLVSGWDVPTVPHCSNCRFARIGGWPPDEVTASCAKGHGKDSIDLFRLIRPRSPRGFRSAITCPDFQSMTDGEEP